jgi:hypothetical protein
LVKFLSRGNELIVVQEVIDTQRVVVEIEGEQPVAPTVVDAPPKIVAIGDGRGILDLHQDGDPDRRRVGRAGNVPRRAPNIQKVTVVGWGTKPDESTLSPPGEKAGDQAVPSGTVSDPVSLADEGQILAETLGRLELCFIQQSFRPPGQGSEKPGSTPAKPANPQSIASILWCP